MPNKKRNKRRTCFFIGEARDLGKVGRRHAMPCNHETEKTREWFPGPGGEFAKTEKERKKM